MSLVKIASRLQKPKWRPSITLSHFAAKSPFTKFLPLIGIGFVLGSQLVPNLSGRAAIGVSGDFVEVGNLQTARCSMHHHCTNTIRSENISVSDISKITALCVNKVA